MEGPVVVRLTSVDSTQSAARQLQIGSIVVAEHQTGGRGRLDRRWEAPPSSALLATFVVARHPLASLAAGVATAEACGPEARLKWPNDVLLRGRKLAGILVEATDDRCLVGIGVNLSWAPPGAALLHGVSRDDLLTRLRAGLGRWLQAPPAAMLERWRQLSDTLGRNVRVEMGRETWTGIAEAIDSDGSLLVGGRAVSAGEITHLRAVEVGEAPPRSDP